MTTILTSSLRRSSRFGSVLLLLLGMVACNGSNNSTPGAAIQPSGPLEPTALARGDDAPGIALAITSISGQTASDGTFRTGDRLSVTFTAKKRNGSSWRLDDFALGRILVSGPTVNYQRVLPEKADLLTASKRNADGSFTYTFADGLPTTFAPPLNDTASFGDADGEWQGRALIAGTYTVGMYVGWNYTVDGVAHSDAGDATGDYLFGGAVTIAHREVVAGTNCNQCHSSLRAHGGLRRSVQLCVLCHTSGAEDKNVATAANGTPGVSVDFRVMIHRIHNGAHLPSVLGVASNVDGTRNYAATPTPLEIVGFQNSVNDFSDVHFPAWPNGLIAMPRRQGYTALSAGQKLQDDAIRTGVIDCAACHGDPDGSGPLPAPAQGGVAFAQSTRRACGACHDDVDFTHPYTQNGSTMPPQLDDSGCIVCHGDIGTRLHPANAHRHPLQDPSVNSGTNLTVTRVAEAGVNNADGTIDPGEKVAVTFRMTDDAGSDLAPSAVASITAIVSGPTSNSNLLLNGSIPVAALSGAQPFTVNLPQTIALEYVGDAASVHTFATARTPHWDVTGAVTNVFTRTFPGTGGNSTLTAAATAPGNWLDVASATNFARNDFVVVDDGLGTIEYLQIGYVEGNRLWFPSTVLTKNHAFGAAVREVTLTQKTRTTDYTLNAATGAIAEVGAQFGGNPVVVTYTTDYVVPTVYPLALNDTPTLDETVGKWVGKPLVDGTYAVTMYASRNLTLVRDTETNSYRSTSVGARSEFLLGGASVLEPYALIADGQSCNACHRDLQFHGGGRRGFATCIACHGTSGCEDRPQYIAPNAPATAGVTINFRSMLHKIHMGEELTNASTYQVVGFGAGAFPNNFTTASYAEVVFPVMPGGVTECVKCHGADNTAWQAARPRTHPTAQVLPTLAWRLVCNSCHDSDAATAHMDAQTPIGGEEACAVCHGDGREWNVQLMHKLH